MDRRTHVRNFSHVDDHFFRDNMAASAPVEYITSNVGRNSRAFFNSNMRSNGHLPLSFPRDTPYSRVTVSSNIPTLQSAHQIHHLQPSPNSNGILQSNVQHSPSAYHRQMLAIRNGLATNTQQDNQRLPSKRKHPELSTAYETVDSNGFHTGASSSQIHASSGNINQNLMPDSLLQPWEDNNMIPNDQPNSHIETEGWQRNVMRRLNTAHDVNRSLTGSHLPNINSMHPDQNRTELSLSGNHQTFNQRMHSSRFHRSGDFHSQNPGQQIYNSHRGTTTSGYGTFNYETSQPFVQHTSRLMTDGRHHGSIVPSRNQNGRQRIATDRLTSNTIPFPVADRQLGPESSFGFSRSVPIRALSRNRSSPMGCLTYPEEGRQVGSETFGRSSIPAMRVSQNSEERGWNRNFNGEIQPLPPFNNNVRRFPEVQLTTSQLSSHDSRRLLDFIDDMSFSTEHVSFEEHNENANRQRINDLNSMSRSTLYGHFSSFDQYANMRLDVDNMSYEELLALGERIGNVNAGISDDNVSSCVKEMTYYCQKNQVREETDRCAICLEDYEEEEKIGILQCHHEYHFSCIKQWLQRKTTCPICKSSVCEK